MSIDVKPHAYDPATQPELFDGVLSRRVAAFIIDFIILAIPVVLVAMFIFVFGIVTIGLGFALYWLLPPGTVIWALLYFGATLGGPNSATIGMRAGLFRTRCSARHRLLVHGLVLYSVRSFGCLLQ